MSLTFIALVIFAVAAWIKGAATMFKSDSSYTDYFFAWILTGAAFVWLAYATNWMLMVAAPGLLVACVLLTMFTRRNLARFLRGIEAKAR